MPRTVPPNSAAAVTAEATSGAQPGTQAGTAGTEQRSVDDSALNGVLAAIIDLFLCVGLRLLASVP
jgi:hypothetical protein